MACKNAKFALQHPIIFGVLASAWTTLKTEKRKITFSWELKSVSGHLKRTGSQACSINNWAWWAVPFQQIRTPKRACREHKAFYLSSQVEPSVSALWVKDHSKATWYSQAASGPSDHGALQHANGNPSGFPLVSSYHGPLSRSPPGASNIKKTSKSKLSLINFPFSPPANFGFRKKCWYRRVNEHVRYKSPRKHTLSAVMLLEKT